MSLNMFQYYFAFTGETQTYNLKDIMFPRTSFIEQPLLEDVIQCYKKRQTVCRNCFYKDFKVCKSLSDKRRCTQCHQVYKELLVIPKSSMTVNHYKFEMIPIPPWAKSKPNKLPFESCTKPTKNHKHCLFIACNSAVWYAHTVEELVIWTVEREYGKYKCGSAQDSYRAEPYYVVHN